MLKCAFCTFLNSSLTFEICWLRFLKTVGKILILIARTIVVQGKLPALLKSPFFFKTFSVQKRGEGAGAPVGFFGDTGSEKTTQQVGLFPRVCSVCKSKSFLWHFYGIIDVLGHCSFTVPCLICFSSCHRPSDGSSLSAPTGGFTGSVEMLRERR